MMPVLGRVKRAARLTNCVKLRKEVREHSAKTSEAGEAYGTPDPHGLLQAVLLDEAGVEKLEENLPYESGAPLIPRLERGHRCHAFRRAGDGTGEDSGAVESFVWVASGPGSAYVYELGGEVFVPDGVAWIYEAFTFPRSRGRGLASGLLARVLAGLRKGHATDVPGAPSSAEAWVSPGNAASMKVFRGAGFEPYGSWKLAALGPVRFLSGDPTIAWKAPRRMTPPVVAPGRLPEGRRT